jgi:hypothetical protein
VSEEYREAFGEHAYDEQGNYIGFDYAATEFTPETEAQAAWSEYVAEHGSPPEGAELPAGVERPPTATAPPAASAAPTASADAPVVEAAAEAPAPEAAVVDSSPPPAEAPAAAPPEG